MSGIRYSNLKKILLNLMPAKEPVLITGRPGIGKTSLIHEVQNELGYDLMISHPVVKEPIDYKGLPFVHVSKDGAVKADFYPYGELTDLMQATKPTIWFIDDLGQARPQVQAPLMQIILERAIDGVPISPEIRIVAATNRREDNAAVQGLITPLIDRFIGVFELEYDHDDFLTWGRTESRVPSVVLAFISYRPELMSKYAVSRNIEKTPTPRSVAGLGRLVQYGIDDRQAYIAAVGEGFGSEFGAFIQVWKSLPDLKKIWKNPAKEPVPAKLDVKYALMAALAERTTKDEMAATVTYLLRVEPEFSMFCMKDLIGRKPALVTHSAFAEWTKAHAF